jgi:tRNA 2-selenouridine synthase
VSTFEARKVGAALVARNIAHHIERQFADRPREWKPLVYCWRGGKRSGAMTHILRQVGWDAHQLAGGYKSFRRSVVTDLERLIPSFTFRVLCGMTGTGKSDLLQQLARFGAQVLDLEGLAEHRGSLLGSVPGIAQPSQKMFETRLWQALRKLNPSDPVYIESESRKVGDVRTPESLLQKMWSSDCIVLDAAMPVRVERLLADYRHLTEDADMLFGRLDCLTAMHGRERIAQWKQMAARAEWHRFIEAMLVEHYDLAYRKSIEAHYPKLGSACRLQVTDATPVAIERIAHTLRSDQASEGRMLYSDQPTVPNT